MNVVGIAFAVASLATIEATTWWEMVLGFLIMIWCIGYSLYRSKKDK